MVVKTFKYRLYPSKPQRRLLDQTLETCRRWYNACLAERKSAWETAHRNVSKFEQLAKVKNYRKDNPFAAQLHSHILQVVVADLDKAFQAFFRRVKAGGKPGYPRFKGRNRFDSFGLKEYGNGFKLDGRRLRLSGIGRLHVRWHRPIEGKIKTVRIRRQAGEWYACFACEIEPRPLPPTGREVGIDVGIYHLLATSDNQIVDNPRWYLGQRAKLRVIQRRVSRRKLGGANRRKAVLALQRQHEHLTNCRKDYPDKLTYRFITHYDHISLEDLRIDEMIEQSSASHYHSLSISILDAGWGYLRQHLIGKAEEAGRQAYLVDPAYTSKICCSCGRLLPDLSLADRWIECTCGLSIDRDINAACNILKRAGHARWGESTASRLRLPQEAPPL
jgi:putative transposase